MGLLNPTLKCGAHFRVRRSAHTLPCGAQYMVSYLQQKRMLNSTLNLPDASAELTLDLQGAEMRHGPRSAPSSGPVAWQGLNLPVKAYS